MPFFGDQQCLYNLSLPCSAPPGEEDTEVRTMAICPHEAFCEMCAADNSLLQATREAVEDGTLPDAYTTHPVSLANPGGPPAVPISLFIDGVPYSQTDGVVGVWLIEEVHGQRRLLAALRKPMTCNCGCRGWCSFHALFEWLS